MRPTKKQAKIIRKAVKHNTANLRLAFIEAAVEINSRLSDKMTIFNVQSAWYQYLKWGKEVFSSEFQGCKFINYKTLTK